MENVIQTNNYGEVKLSGSEVDIVELIQKLRNDMIRDFLDERFLKNYVQTKYHHSEISSVKLEFIRRDLKGLYLSPLNTDHYKPLIEEIQSQRKTYLEGSEPVFYRDVESIFEKYIFDD